MPSISHYSSMFGIGSGFNFYGKNKSTAHGPDFSCADTEVDCIIEESWSRQMEQDISDKVRKEIKEKFQIEKEQIKLDAQVELRKAKTQHEEEMKAKKDEIKKWRNIKRVLKDQYKGEVKLLRRRIDDLEEELEGWRNS